MKLTGIETSAAPKKVASRPLVSNGVIGPRLFPHAVIVTASVSNSRHQRKAAGVYLTVAGRAKRKFRL
jgi:hypothetical protein